MYKEQTSNVCTSQSDHKFFTKGKKAKKSEFSLILKELNSLYANGASGSSKESCLNVHILTKRLIHLIAHMKPKKVDFEDILSRNIILAWNSKNASSIFFHTKLIELYIRSGLNLAVVAAELNSIELCPGVEVLVNEKFGLNLAFFTQNNHKKLQSLTHKSLTFTFRLISLESDKNWTNFYNNFLGQSVMTQCFSVYFQVFLSYLLSLQKRQFNFFPIDTLLAMQMFLNFKQTEDFLRENQNYFLQIVFQYTKILKNDIYVQHLTSNRKSFASVFNTIVDRLLQLGNTNSQKLFFSLYVFLNDCDVGVIKCIVPHGDTDEISSSLKQSFILGLKTLAISKLTLEQISLSQLRHLRASLFINQKKLIWSRNNFACLIDLVVNGLEKIKRSFISLHFRVECFNSQFEFRKSEMQNFLRVQQIVDIQAFFLTNEKYLSLNNYLNVGYLSTCAYIEILVEWLKCCRGQHGSTVLKVQSWISKFDEINFKDSELHATFHNLATILANYLRAAEFPGKRNDTCLSSLIALFQSKHIAQIELKVYREVHRKVIHCVQSVEKKFRHQRWFDQNRLLTELTEILVQNVLRFIKRNRKSLSRQNSKEIDLIRTSIQLCCSKTIIFESLTEGAFVKYLQTVVSEGLTQSTIVLEALQVSILMRLDNQCLEEDKGKSQHQQFGNEASETIQEYMRRNLLLYSKIFKSSVFSKGNLFEAADFIMHLKSIIRFEFSSSPNFHFLNEAILDGEKAIFKGKKVESHINSLCKKYLSEGVKIFENSQNSSVLETVVQLLTKKLYLSTHTDKFSESINQKCNLEIFKNGPQDQTDLSPNPNANQKTEKKSKRQKQQTIESQFQESLLDLENSCISLSGIREICKDFMPIIRSFVRFSPPFQAKIKKAEYVQLDLQSMKNPVRVINCLWNICWALKFCSMHQDLKMIIALRQSILAAIDHRLQSVHSRLQEIQIFKMVKFGLLQKENIYEVEQNQNGLNYSSDLEDAIKKIYRGSPDISRFELEFIQKLPNVSLYKTIHASNNLQSAYNCRKLISFCTFHVYHSNIATQNPNDIALPLLQIQAKHSYSNSSSFLQKSNSDCQREIYERRSIVLEQVQDHGIYYPLLKNIFSRLVSIASQKQEVSNFRSLLGIILSFFCKIGLIQEMHGIMEIVLSKKLKISTIKIVDCIRTLNQGFKIPGERKPQNSRLRSLSKEKVFDRIQKFLNNKRRSVSGKFNLKSIFELIEGIKHSGIYHNRVLSKILLSQLRQQFHLYNYHVESIFHQIYNGQFLQIQNPSSLFCQKQSQKLTLVEEVLHLTVWKKEALKQLSLNELQSKLQELLDAFWTISAKNFYFSSILENLVGFLVDSIVENIERQNSERIRSFFSKLQFVNQAVLKVALHMLEFNYAYKEQMYNLPSVVIKKQSFVNFFEIIQQQRKQISNFRSQYSYKIEKKVQYLLSFKCPWPISIVYPLRKKIYNISISNCMVVTQNEYFDFEYSLEMMEKIIENDSDVVIKQKNPKQWWNSRNRLNREIGKVSANSSLGLFSFKPVTKVNELRNEIEKCFQQKKSKSQQIDNLKRTVLQVCLHPQQEIACSFLQFLIEYSGLNLSQSESLKSIFLREKQLAEQSKGQNIEKVFNNSLLIYCHHAFNLFPFQELNDLKLCEGIYRLPSIEYLCNSLETYKIDRTEPRFLINLKCVNYCVDPQNQLQNARTSFSTLLNRLNKTAEMSMMKLSWKGSKGCEFPAERLFKSLCENSLYLYMGHGNGFALRKQSEISPLKVCAPCMLLGCSSICQNASHAQNYGIPFLLLLKGCPSLIGCLWDVTDKDIDLFAVEFFSSAQSYTKDLSSMIQQAKKEMKFRFLTGSAIVAYGLPSSVVLD